MQPSYVILYVKDPAASAGFYTRILGIGPVEASPGFVMYVLSSGLKLGLWKKSEVQPAVSAHPGASELCISTDSREVVDATVAGWRAAGTSIVMEPAALDFGYGFVARDPDGHLIRVFHPGEAPA